MHSELLMGRLSDGLVLRVEGRGPLRESPAFREAAKSGLARGVVVFDTSACEYLDSTFVGCLIGIQKMAELSPDCRFLIAASPETRIKLFSTTSLDTYFHFVEAVPEPVAEFVEIDVDELDPEALGRHVLGCHRRLADMGGRDAAAFKAVADRLAQELGDEDLSQDLD